MFHKYVGDSKMFEYDKYYRECQQENKPFIKAKTNPVHKNYFIQIDLMPCNRELSSEEQEEIKKLVLVEMEYVKSKCDYDFGGFNITSELSWFDGIPSEHVDDFCNGVYDLVQGRH
ncbi:MAG: hypothetical protein GKS07_08175 [Nitrosopumilus sp.]|nr:MAG: hypothetical protein GKS07_08175 [Nitrosopumilus sp.]